MRIPMRTSSTGKRARRTLWPAFAVRTELLVVVVGVLLLAPARVLCTSVICNQKPVKPLRHICGIVIDESGTPFPRVRVTILKGASEVATVQTGDDGKFSFEGLKGANYELQAQKDGFHDFRIPVVLVKPRGRCTRALEILLSVARPCPEWRLVKPKVVAQRLNRVRQ